MLTFATIAGIVVILAVLLDAFETVVLPRRVRRKFRITVWFYRYTWVPWRKITSLIKSPGRRENFLGYFGPLSLLFLLALWACGLIFGFGLLQYGAGEHVQLSNEPTTFARVIYFSGSTFFTLGYGDVIPTSSFARVLAVLEAGMGFGFLGTVVAAFMAGRDAQSSAGPEVRGRSGAEAAGSLRHGYRRDGPAG